MKATTLGILCLLLSFNGLSQEKNTEPSQRHAETMAAYEQFVTEAAADRRLNPIRTRLPAQIANATLAQRGSTSKPTKAERAAIDALDELMGALWQRYKDIAYKYGDVEGVVATARYAESYRNTLAKLRSGQWTYGEYISHLLMSSARAQEEAVAQVRRDEYKRAEQEKAASAAAAEYAREIERNRRMEEAIKAQQDALRAQSDAIARAQANAASDALIQQGIQLMQMGQPRYAQPQHSFPSQTNCQQYGNQTRCTTW